MKNEFGKLTLEQLKQILNFMPELDGQRTEDIAAIRAHPEKLRKCLTNDYNWSKFYEQPFEGHLAYFLLTTGIAPGLVEACKSVDPLQGAINYFQVPRPSSVDDACSKLALKDVIALEFSINKSLECVPIFGCYLNDLIATAKSEDIDDRTRDKALLNAIRIDPAVIAGPTCADRIAHAVIVDDQAFFRKLQNALKGKTGRQVKYLEEIRVVLRILREAGVERLSDVELEKLFIKELKLYQASSSSIKNIREQFYKSGKKSTI